MHNLTQLAGLFGKGGAAGGGGATSILDLTLADYKLDTDNGASYTYTRNVDVGDFLIIGAAYTGDNNAWVEVSGITVGGNPTTLIGAAASTGMAFYYIVHPGGVDASMTITLADTANRGQIGVWALNGTPSSWTPGDTLEIAEDAMTGTIDVLAGGILLGIEINSTNGGANWDGVTRRYGGALNRRGASGASDNIASTETGKEIIVSVGEAYLVAIR